MPPATTEVIGPNHKDKSDISVQLTSVNLMLDKANAAIVRAADTKEVRISLTKWFAK